MSRKDFELIARTIRETYDLTTHSAKTIETLILLAIRFADQLATTNPNFDRRRFLLACGLSEGTIDHYT